MKIATSPEGAVFHGHFTHAPILVNLENRLVF